MEELKTNILLVLFKPEMTSEILQIILTFFLRVFYSATHTHTYTYELYTHLLLGCVCVGFSCCSFYVRFLFLCHFLFVLFFSHSLPLHVATHGVACVYKT